MDKVIFSKDPGDANLCRITTNPKEDRDPAWHPGGNIIAFSSYQKEQGTDVLNFGISIYDLNDEKYGLIR